MPIDLSVGHEGIWAKTRYKTLQDNRKHVGKTQE